jgi:type II secretory pathway pseudopilin PulG
MKMKIYNGQKGFTLAELVVTMGLLGGMSIYLLDMISGIRETEKQSLAFFSISTVTMDIVNILQDQDSCTETLGGLDPSPAFPNGATIPAIRRVTSGLTGANVRDVYTEDQVVDRLAGGGGVVQIDSMLLSNYGTPGAGTLYRTSARQAYVTITYKVGAAADRTDGVGVDWDAMDDTQKAELRNRVGSMPIVVKRIPIQVQLNAGGTIERCNAGGVWTEYLSDLCVDVLQGTPSGSPVRCRNMKIHATTGAQEVGTPVAADTMLEADGRYQVEDAHKTEFLKVGSTTTDYTMNPGMRVQLERSLWTNSLRVGSGITSPGDDNVSFSGTLYIGDFSNTRNFRRQLRLGAPGAPQGIEVMGNTPAGTDPALTSITVQSGIVRMDDPPYNTAYPSAGGAAGRIDRSDAARARWVAETIARTLGDTGADINTIINQLRSNENATGLAGDILKRYICVNTQMRRFSQQDSREQAALPNSDQYWVSGRMVSGNCVFGTVAEDDANNLHLKRNCSREGNCHAIEAQNAICVGGVCKTRWPYIIQDSVCNWKLACAANEMPFGRRTSSPANLCCTVRFEN